MPQKLSTKSFSYGGQKKKKDLWDSINDDKSTTNETKIPKSKGIWTNIRRGSEYLAPKKMPNIRECTVEVEDPFRFNERLEPSFSVNGDPYTHDQYNCTLNDMKLKIVKSPTSPSPKKSPLLQGKAFPKQRKVFSSNDLKVSTIHSRKRKLVVNKFSKNTEKIEDTKINSCQNKDLVENVTNSDDFALLSESNEDIEQKEIVETCTKKRQIRTYEMGIRNKSNQHDKMKDSPTLQNEHTTVNNSKLTPMKDDLELEGKTRDISRKESNKTVESCFAETFLKDRKENQRLQENKILKIQDSKPKSFFSYYNKSSISKKPSHKGIYTDVNKPRITEDSDNEEEYSDSQSTIASVGNSQDCSSSQDNKLQENVREISSSISEVKVKSPFKTLKPSYRSKNKDPDLRRFSSLPTCLDFDGVNDIESQNEEKEQEGKEEKIPEALYCSTIFGVHFTNDTAKRVKRSEKELYKVVRNTKTAYQCLDMGESQQFQDDIDYLLDGLKSNHDVSTRCLSALEIASKCLSPNFRMHIKAHGFVESVFNHLQDALSNERLALCTSAILYVLVNDKMSINFDKKIIECILKLMTTKDTTEVKKKDYQKLVNKIKKKFENQEFPDLDLNKIDTNLLARETLLSLSSKQTGEWFKEEIRTLGGLDHLIDAVYTNSCCLSEKVDVQLNCRTIERCLLLISDVLSKNAENERYVLSYRNGLLLEACVRTLSAVSNNPDLNSDILPELEACLFIILQNMVKLTDENVDGCNQICKHEDAIPSLLKCAICFSLRMKRNGDFMVMCLGVLINLIVKNKSSIYTICAVMVPALSTCENDSSEDHVSAMDALIALFVHHYDSCKETDALLDVQLDKIEEDDENEKKKLHYQDDEDALTCGDNFDDTVEDDINETIGSSNEENHLQPENKSNKKDELSENDKKDIKFVLQKAHLNMVHSHVAAYTALLLGLLAENNLDNQDSMRTQLPNGDFTNLFESLEKIYAFVKAAGTVSEKGAKVIERIIQFFKSCVNS